MRWASALSERSLLSEALAECATEIREQMGPGTEPDLVVAFASPHFARDYDRLPAEVCERFPSASLLGCSGAGVIGDSRELEGRVGLSLTAAYLPNVSLVPFHLTVGDCPSPDSPPEAWMTLVGTRPEASPSFVLLMDPFSMPGEDLLAGLDFAFPASPKVGGLASGGQTRGSHALFLNGATLREGVVGLALSGDVVVDTVVAQGCRPVGEVMRVTQADRSLLQALDGELPLQMLERLYHRLPPRDQELLQGNLFLGMAMDPLRDEVGPGEFLVRNVVGADPQHGFLVIGALLREGQLVQFHVRDSSTSAEDLQRCLQDYMVERRGQMPQGALLFSCTGRGMHLYGQPDHDTEMFRRLVGGLPLSGFFCNGEIGPVGGTTYLHGYTSSFAVFRPQLVPD